MFVNRPRLQFYLLLLFFLILGFGIYLKNIGDLYAWTYYGWLWNYDFGFMKRALPGALLDLFVTPPISIRTVSRIGLAIGVILVIQLSVLSAAVTAHYFRSFVVWTLVLGFMLAGFGLQNVGHMLGVFEHINLIIAIAVFVILRSGSLSAIRCFIAGIVAAVMILVHEAAVFFLFPVLVAFILHRTTRAAQKPTDAFTTILFFLAAPIVASVLVYLHPLPDLSQSEFIRIMRARGSHDELTMVHHFALMFDQRLPRYLREMFEMYRDNKLAWIGAAYTVVFMIVLGGLHRVLLVRFGVLGRMSSASWISRLLAFLPILVPAFGLLLPGDLLRFLSLVPVALFLFWCFVWLDDHLEITDFSPRHSTEICAAAALMWAWSFWVFPAYGFHPNLSDRLQCVLSFYPHRGPPPIHRSLCLEQRIEYYRGRKN